MRTTKEIIEDIRKLYGDSSVDAYTTIERLDEILEEVLELKCCLKSEL